MDDKQKWETWARQLTGKPKRYHGYFGLMIGSPTGRCHAGYHKSQDAAESCAARALSRYQRHTKQITSAR